MMMKAIIKSDLIRAAMLCINPKEETRFYLHGIHIDGTQIASTDGHRLFVGLVKEPMGDVITVPYGVLKIALPAMRKAADVIICKYHDDWLMLVGDQRFIFSPIDYQYALYKDIMDAPLGEESPSKFNPSYYNDLGKIAKILCGWKNDFRVFQCGDGAAGIKFKGREDCKMKLMPMQTDGSIVW